MAVGNAATDPADAAVITAVVVLGSDATAELVARVASAAGATDAELATACDRLRRAQVVTGAGVLGLAHPELGAVALEVIGHAGVTAMHERAAAALHDEGGDPVTIGRHLLATPTTGDSWVTQALLDAADRARAGGDQILAARLLERALFERVTEAQRRAILLDLAAAKARVEPDAAASHYREVLPLLDDATARAATRLRLARCLGAADRVVEALEEADVAGVEAVDPAGRLSADLTYVALARQHLDTRPLGRARLDRLIASLPAEVTDPSSRGALAELAYEQVLVGVRYDEVVSNALRAFGGASLDAIHDVPAMSRHGALLALCWSGELRTAERAATVLLARAERRGATADRASANAVLANVHWRRGDAAGTLAAAEAALRTGVTALLPACMGHRAMALALLGRVDDAYEALELPGGDQRWSAVASFHGYLVGVIQTHLAAGADDEAFRTAQRLGALATAMGTTNPAVVPWRTLGALAASASGRADEARTLADEAVALTRAFGAADALAAALRAAARVRASDDALALLDESAALAVRTPNAALRSAVALDRAQRLGAAGRAGEARCAAEEALALAEAVGAVALATAAKGLLERDLAVLPQPTSARGTAPHAELRVLGRFAVLDPSGQEVPLRGVPGRAARILVAAGRPLHVEELAELLWDEPLEPQQVRARLPNVLARARTPHGPLLQRVGEMVSLHPGVAVDADRFDAAAAHALARAREGGAEAVDAALTAVLLYGGDLLPTDPYADWAMLRREQVRRRFLVVSDVAAHLAATAGMTDTAVDVLETAIRHDPYDVDRYATAATILDAAGRTAASAAMRERAERVRRELDL